MKLCGEGCPSSRRGPETQPSRGYVWHEDEGYEEREKRDSENHGNRQEDPFAYEADDSRFSFTFLMGGVLNSIFIVTRKFSD